MFASAQAFLAATMRGPAPGNEAWRDGFLAEIPTVGAWNGNVKSLEEGAALAQSGVVRDFAKAARVANAATLAPVHKRSIVYSVAGGAPSVPRVLSSRPDVMRRMRREIRMLPVARIILSIGANATVSADALAARGLAILGAVDAIARAGHPVELWATVAARAYEKSMERVHGGSLCLKPAGMPLDWQRVAFWTCHAAALRVVGFASLDLLSTSARTALGHGFGSALSSTADVLLAAPEGLTFGAVIPSPRSDSDCYSLRADTLAASAIAAATK